MVNAQCIVRAYPVRELAMLRSTLVAPVALTLLLALPAFAFAQADDTLVPPSSCVKPTVPAAGTALDKAAAEKLNSESKAYSACADAYMTARRTAANKYQLIANTQINAANAFAADFNTFATALDGFSKAQAAKAASDKVESKAAGQSGKY